MGRHCGDWTMCVWNRLEWSRPGSSCLLEVISDCLLWYRLHLFFMPTWFFNFFHHSLMLHFLSFWDKMEWFQRWIRSELSSKAYCLYGFFHLLLFQYHRNTKPGDVWCLWKVESMDLCRQDSILAVVDQDGLQNHHCLQIKVAISPDTTGCEGTSIWLIKVLHFQHFFPCCFTLITEHQVTLRTLLG